MALLFLDTNILLRHFLQDDANQAPKASAFLKRVETGDVKVRTAETVIFEKSLPYKRDIAGRNQSSVISSYP
jgi:predicted nucleic-acid-binding protein